MTKEEYREHLCSVIVAVFSAEDTVNERDPELLIKLRSHTISPEDYIYAIADEMLSATPDEELERILKEDDIV